MFQVPGVQFAVANDTNYTYSGTLGLGYTYPFTTKYPTLLSMMWALGYVQAPVFSMGLGGDGDGFSESPRSLSLFYCEDVFLVFSFIFLFCLAFLSPLLTRQQARSYSGASTGGNSRARWNRCRSGHPSTSRTRPGCSTFFLSLSLSLSFFLLFFCLLFSTARTGLSNRRGDDRYWVNVTSIGTTPPGQPSRVYTPSATFNMPMLIDSGSTLSYIREDIVQAVGQQLGATVDSNNNYWVDCNLRKQNGTVDFGFNHGRMVVTVRYKDFIWEEYRGHCLMGFQPADAGSTNYVLGDTFLRGAYRQSLSLSLSLYLFPVSLFVSSSLCLSLSITDNTDPAHSGVRPAVGRRVDRRLLQLRRRRGHGRREARGHAECHRPMLISVLSCVGPLRHPPPV